MKDALLDFYLRTAYNRDAIEYFQQFHSIPPERFALIVPGRGVWEEERQAFLEGLGYLLRLGLSPTVFLSPAFMGARAAREARRTLERLESEGEGNWRIFFSPEAADRDPLRGLQRAGARCRFFKHLLVLPDGLSDAEGRRPSRVALRRSRLRWSSASTRVMAWLAPFLERLGPAASVQVVRPAELLAELFTASGSGTLISLGYRFAWLDAGEVDRGRLKALVERGFGRLLAPGYFDALGEDWRVLAEEDWIGAIVIRPVGDMRYMDKFVVAPEHLHRGVGTMLLEELLERLASIGRDMPRLFWRARHDNPYLPRYAGLLSRAAARHPLSCGTLGDERYVYHFLGLEHGRQQRAVRWMRRLPSSFAGE